MQYLTHTMQSGDTLQSVAAAYQVGIDALIAANPQLMTEAVICPGSVLALPRRNDPYPCGSPNPLPLPQPWPTWPQQPEPAPLPEPEPWPTPQPNPGADASAQLEGEVAALVNQERARRGLPELVVNWTLGGVARTKSEDMATGNYFDHNSPTYGTPFDMLRRFGFAYAAAGENIAKGQTTAEQVMNTWMNSPGHAANILSSAYTELGVGYAYNNGVPVWTQLFLRP